MSRFFVRHGLRGASKVIWVGYRSQPEGWRGAWIGWNTRPLFSEREGYKTGPYRIGKFAVMFGPARRLRDFP